MYSVYDDWPKIALDSFESQYEQTDYKNIDHIVFYEKPFLKFIVMRRLTLIMLIKIKVDLS